MTNDVIYKYPLELEQQLPDANIMIADVPHGVTPMKIEEDPIKGGPALWAIVDPTLPLTYLIRVFIVPTGGRAPRSTVYLNSYTQQYLQFHVFYQILPKDQ